jgi:hypothetical protein
VPSPTLQAYARGKAQSLLPLETSIMRRVPGYEGIVQNEVWLRGRKDQLDIRGDLMRVRGGEPAQIWMVTAEPFETAVFEVSTEAPNSDIRLRLPGGETEVSFRNARRAKDKTQIVDVPAGRPKPFNPAEGFPGYVYTLVVDAPLGQIVRNKAGSIVPPRFYLGASLRFLGSREQLQDPARYAVTWNACEVPPTIEAGAQFSGLTAAVNTGPAPWPVSRPTQVAFSYHWLDADGSTYQYEGARTNLETPVAAGEEVEIEQLFEAP